MDFKDMTPSRRKLILLRMRRAGTEGKRQRALTRSLGQVTCERPSRAGGMSQ